MKSSHLSRAGGAGPADKESLVAACLEPGAALSEIARAAGIHVSQFFRWPDAPMANGGQRKDQWEPQRRFKTRYRDFIFLTLGAPGMDRYPPETMPMLCDMKFRKAQDRYCGVGSRIAMPSKQRRSKL
ncbi:transposase [Ensifer sp. YR511]|uniref:transposase n=1 Tax=Ensifer sp. YR511 TaxID=1855294 RepID=UPI0015A2C788|nr:transposase [Ensifer sp. YR511]